VQTIEWCDRLTAHEGDSEDALEILGPDIDPDENLILIALEKARARAHVPPLSLTLEKNLPIAAGLGGGSSDAAATLRLAAELGDLSEEQVAGVASEVGADVPLFLKGGSLMMAGVGEVLTSVEPLTDFVVAVVVPGFGLATADVYRRWDEMEGPLGEVITNQMLPPSLRDGMPIRNDLVPAALDIESRLGDFIADIRAVWGTAVSMTGSGSACFGYFASVTEASDAAAAVEGLCETTVGVRLRDIGVSSI
jgi:4-diphosphocytidyl-2-C-methyl-D-erythritol kinase